MGNRKKRTAARSEPRRKKAQHKAVHPTPRRKRGKLPAENRRKTTDPCTQPPEQLAKPSEQPTEPTGHLADCHRRAALVHELMAQFPGENIEQLAHRIGICAHTLSLSYKTATGNTLQDILLENCFQHATRLLTTGTTEHSIKQIAQTCGYADKSSFTHAFTRRFGKSPREYRRQHGVTASPPSRTAGCWPRTASSN